MCVFLDVVKLKPALLGNADSWRIISFGISDDVAKCFSFGLVVFGFEDCP